jgi:hypothetical protein
MESGAALLSVEGEGGAKKRGIAEQGPGADCCQRPLVPRSRFQPQLTPGVRQFDTVGTVSEGSNYGGAL